MNKNREEVPIHSGRSDEDAVARDLRTLTGSCRGTPQFVWFTVDKFWRMVSVSDSWQCEEVAEQQPEPEIPPIGSNTHLDWYVPMQEDDS